MGNLKFVHRILTLLLLINFLQRSLSGVCELCVCVETESSRIVNCEGKREINNYTEIFDLLAFDDYKGAEKLILSKHEIISLPLDAFRGLRLQSLDLSENSILDIEADVFKDLFTLEELNFSFNRLSGLRGAAFSNVESLLNLNLSNNRIADLNEITANQLPNLTHLDLSHNHLESIDSSFLKSLKSLKFLDISFNVIGTLSGETIPQLRSLIDLRAGHNKLKKLCGEYLPMSLKLLSVGHNAIASVPKNLSPIRELNIEDNNISSIKDDVGSLNKLERLNISGNALIEFPDAKFEYLKTLDLSRNKLTTIPETLKFDNLPILEELSLGGNPIRNVTFAMELRLRKLILRNLNLLEAIEIHAFRHLKGFHDRCINLTVSQNRRLNMIEKGAFDGIAICHLDLSKNAFTHIPQSVIKSSSNFVAQNGIDLQMNPFNCDCKSQWMLDDLVPYLYKINPELLEDLRCSKPLELAGRRMVHWLTWEKPVFCDTSPQVLSKMIVDTSAVLIRSESTIRLESSRGMLAIVAGAMGAFFLLLVTGILIARRLTIRRRHTNRRF